MMINTAQFVSVHLYRFSVFSLLILLLQWNLYVEKQNV